MKTPSFRLQGFLCLITTAKVTFLRNSGLPFFTVARTISPGPAFGKRLSRDPHPLTAIIYKFFAPVLSAQFMTAATGRPQVKRNLLPLAALPASYHICFSFFSFLVDFCKVNILMQTSLTHCSKVKEKR